MNTQVKSSNGITLVPLESRLLSDRKIFLEGEITECSAMEFIRKLMVLIAEDARRTVKVVINTAGGEVNSGMLIYDVLQSCETPLELYCFGKAYSMGAVILAAGKRGSRFMLENSELMLHEPLIGDRVSGSSSSLKSISESLQETKTKLNRILAKHTGKTEEEIDRATGYDHYFKAQEAVDFGLADRVVGFDRIL